MVDTNSSISTKNSPLEGWQMKSDGVDYPPSDWVETTLGEVVEVKNEKLKISNLSLDNYISTENLLPDRLGVQKSANLPNIPSVNAFKKDDILFSNIRTYFKKVWFAEFDGGASNDVLIFTPKDEGKLDKKFLYYFISSDRFINFTVISAKGTKMPRGDKEAMKTFAFSLPPLPEQKAIASILSAFDDKIELLREQNKTLEEMGQTIFQEWFGKYGVDDELPEGWIVGKLGEIGQVICGKTPSKGNQEYFGGDIPFIKIPDMHGEVFIIRTEDSLTEFGANTQKNKFIPKNSICVSCIATVGLVSITSRDSQTNQQINSIVPSDKKYLEYLYFVLTNMKNDLLAIGSGGSATLNINTSTFSNIKIVIPNKEILNDFHNTTNSIFTKILDNLYQIQSLARNRDELLPKLMTGAVRVKFK